MDATLAAFTGRCKVCGEYEGDNGCVTIGCDAFEAPKPFNQYERFKAIEGYHVALGHLFYAIERGVTDSPYYLFDDMADDYIRQCVRDVIAAHLRMLLATGIMVQ